MNLNLPTPVTIKQLYTAFAKGHSVCIVNGWPAFVTYPKPISPNLHDPIATVFFNNYQLGKHTELRIIPSEVEKVEVTEDGSAVSLTFKDGKCYDPRTYTFHFLAILPPALALRGRYALKSISRTLPFEHSAS